ncbi:hypothetical protein ABZX93_05370 [Streptomyces sp. NPDC006632]|uniref:hypothetical protein n=1 Tax=Streptomyces sp. NPDC006632 TaxID=3157182 RepID=UPI0033A93BA0
MEENRLDSVVEAVSEMESDLKDGGLLSVGVAIRRAAAELGVNDTTTRKDIGALVAAGRLVEVSHVGRRLLLPWPAEFTDPPVRWVNGAVKRGWYEVTEDRQVGPAMVKVRFLFTPERLTAMLERIRQEHAAAAGEQKRRAEESQAEAAEEEATFKKHHPALADLLERLHESVHTPGRSARGVRMFSTEHGDFGLRSRVMIEVSNERFAALEQALRDGLGEEQK